MFDTGSLVKAKTTLNFYDIRESVIFVKKHKCFIILSSCIDEIGLIKLIAFVDGCICMVRFGSELYMHEFIEVI